MNKLLDYLRHEAPDWLFTGAAAAGALLATLVVIRVFRLVVLRVTRDHTIVGRVARRVETPIAFVVALTVLGIVWQAAPDTVPFIARIRHVDGVLWIIALTWLLLR